MPTISMFYGIVVRMYFAPGEHPPPHFHVYYGEYKAKVGIRSCEVMGGNLPRRQEKLTTGGVMYPSVVQVTPYEDFTLAITFDNGEEGILDLKPYLGFGVFQKISNMEQFKSVHVAFDTIEWEQGVDLDPEFVYAQCRKTANA